MTGNVQPIGEPRFVTLDRLRDLVSRDDTVEVPRVGWFRVRALSFGEWMDLRGRLDDGEWEATMALLRAGVVDPPLAEADEETLRALTPDVVQVLTEAISRVSGVTGDFSGGSPTG